MPRDSGLVLSDYVRALEPLVEKLPTRRKAPKEVWVDPMSWDERFEQLLAYRRECALPTAPPHTRFLLCALYFRVGVCRWSCCACACRVVRSGRWADPASSLRPAGWMTSRHPSSRITFLGSVITSSVRPSQDVMSSRAFAFTVFAVLAVMCVVCVSCVPCMCVCGVCS